MMNHPSAATMTGFVMSVVLLLGLAYLAFGERVGIKSPGPDARVHHSVQKQPQPGRRRASFHPKSGMCNRLMECQADLAQGTFRLNLSYTQAQERSPR